MASLLIVALADLVTGVGNIQGLSPRAAGELALPEGRHGEIVAVAQREPITISGEATFDMLERTHAISAGCVRRRWTVLMRDGERGPLSDVIDDRTYSEVEVALPIRGVCPSHNYVSTGSMMTVITPTEAVSGLRWLAELKLRAIRVRFACDDQVASGLCESQASIWRSVLALHPTHIFRARNSILFEIEGDGEHGRVTTEVGYQMNRPRIATISRFVTPLPRRRLG